MRFEVAVVRFVGVRRDGTGSARYVDMVARLASIVLFGASVALVTDGAAAEQAPACPVSEVEYALAGTLRLTDTPYGLGNGAHKVGPGRVVLRFEPGGRVAVLSYSMRQSFTIQVTAFFTTIKVHTESMTRATPNACGVAAEGVLKGSNVEWTTKVRGLRTDGALTCEGNYCGKFGAPEPGSEPIAVGPEDVRVRSFEFTHGGKTFTMPFTPALKMEAPKHTSFLALTGREVRRRCVPPPPPCQP